MGGLSHLQRSTRAHEILPHPPLDGLRCLSPGWGDYFHPPGKAQEVTEDLLGIMTTKPRLNTGRTNPSAFLPTCFVYLTSELCFQGPVMANVKPDFRSFKNIVLPSGENDVPENSESLDAFRANL
jgi:hypothetical protein